MATVKPRGKGNGTGRWLTRKQLAKVLRSGKYAKGSNALAQPGVGYCCLGVLAKERGYTDAQLLKKGELVISGTSASLGDAPKWLDYDFESDLIDANDEYDNWDHVIELLENTSAS